MGNSPGGGIISGNTLTIGTANTTIKAKWELNVFNLSVNANGGTLTKEYEGDYAVGSTITLETPTKTGYTFTGWTSTSGEVNGNIFTMGNADAILTANWSANTNTVYIVNHWTQNLGASTTQNSTNYTVNSTENKTGTTDTSVTPNVKTITGFTSPNTQTKTILADGSLVINYYYTRNSYTYTLRSNTGVSTSGSTTSGSYQYGATITLKVSVNTGYTWNKWTSSNTNLVSDKEAESAAFTMPAGNITMTPNVTANTYTISYELNGGTNGSSAPTSGTYGNTVSVSNPTKTGHTFTGWTVSGTGAILSGTNLTIGASDVTLTANWLANFIGISIKTPPTKTQYNIGDPFDPTGMVVEAVYGDGTTEIITNYTYTPNGWLTEDNKTITISYTKDGITKTTTQAIEVGYIIKITGSGDDGSTVECGVRVDGVNYTTTKNVLVSPGTVIDFYVSGNRYGRFELNNEEMSVVDRIFDDGTYETHYEHTVTSPMTIHLTYASENTDVNNGRIYAITAIDFVSTPPEVIYYHTDDYFDPTGMVITHINADGTKEIVTDYTYVSQTGGDTLTLDDDYMTISYVRNGQTYSTNLPIYIDNSGCFAEGTLITLANGTQKPIEDITYEDELLVWDFYNGTYAVTNPSLIEVGGKRNRSVLNLKFSDGTIARIIDHHGFFDVEENNYVFISESNVGSYIGHKFVKSTEDLGYEYVELVDYEISVENIRYYTLLTAIHSNCIAEGMFTLTPPPIGLDGWYDIFEIGEGMKYDEREIQAEIEKYGLYTYDYFDEYMTYEQFIAYNGPYLKILVEKGVITFEQILEAIYAFSDIISSQQ